MPSTVHLLSLPPRLSDRVWLLELSHNNLSHLPCGSFLGSLRNVGVAAFSQCPVGGGVLRGLGFLEQLDFSHNQLACLPLVFSATMGSLLCLDLSPNLLATLDPCSLWGLGNLEQLDLSHNLLAELGTARLGGLFHLRWLLLAGNDMSELEAQAFVALWVLGLLSVVGNRLQQLKFNIIAGIWAAGTQLLLASNPWVCDCDLQWTFGKLDHLRHLHVANLGNLSCAGPERLAGVVLGSVEAWLCTGLSRAPCWSLAVVPRRLLCWVIVAEHKCRRDPRAAGEQRSPLER
uniref:LRRCT domain-containing protein n=1 Tax=Equus asinus TaxID=9793 RepID=A0A9L0K1N4_EQUAS|nr:leucine-rich repeat-containing protein 26-like [Equus asinus]